MTQHPDLGKKVTLITLFLPWLLYYRAIIFLAPFSKIVSNFPLINSSDTRLNISIEEIRWALHSIERHIPFIPNCWSLASTGYKFALLNGYSAEIRMGIKKQEDTLKAHAWLICNDRVITGAKGHKSYAVTTIIRPGQVVTQLPPQETLADGTVRFANGEKP